jgi:DNA modification methylase
MRPDERSQNALYYGDNLDVMRRYIADESVDLVYLDPPFNSAQNYNVLFEARDGHAAEAQIHAFEDTWRWDRGAETQYREVVERGGKVSEVLQAFRLFLDTNDMLAYLTMMAPRLVELHRVLKPTGSLYLHCDPTASHYLKLLLDAVFGPENFRNEIVWKRTAAHSAAKRWNDVHDTIFFFSKSASYVWRGVVLPHTEKYEARFKRVDEEGTRWTDDNLTAPGVRRGDSGAVWRGYNPTARGNHWKVNLKTVVDLVGKDHAVKLSTTEKLDLLDEHGFILWPKKPPQEGGGFPRFKRSLSGGQAIQDVITDIPPINSQAQERLGYPTQKPEALLDRIIQASSNSDDLVLDPFCGCGTTIASAQRLGRRWIGVDITHLAIGLIRNRLADTYGSAVSYAINGEPTTLEDAEALAQQDKFQFQAWALGLVGARTANTAKKGADKGIDGTLYFHSSAGGGKTDRIILSVKGGKLKADDVRALEGVRAREKAAIGVLISFDEPSKKMRTDAASFGFHDTAWGAFPRIQLLTVKELLEGKRIEYPRITEGNKTFKRAPKAKEADGQGSLGL